MADRTAEHEVSIMPVPFSGGCACGRVRYECTAEPKLMFNCHCRDCQRASGSAYAAVMMVPAAGFRFLSGAPRFHDRIHDDGRVMGRGFCPDCGTPLVGRLSRLPDLIGIRVGTLDDPSWFAPMADFWTSSAQPWDEMNPSVPKYPTQPHPRAEGG
ncbi:MAG: GFA family protein [Polyangiaceae bacterium]|nr:GFA family protein [Polyangiaceae bacterium]